MTALYYFLLAPFTVLLHEIGHVLCALIVRQRVSSFGVGTGKPTFVLNLAGVKIFFCLPTVFNGGITFLIPDENVSRRGTLLILMGGILANLVGGAVGWIAAQRFPAMEEFWNAFALTNGFCILGAMIPGMNRLGKALIPSDGAKILALIRKQTEMPLPGILIHNFQALTPLLEGVGDKVQLANYGCHVARSYLMLWDKEKAATYYTRALSYQPENIPYLERLIAETGYQIALFSKNPEDLLVARQRLLKIVEKQDPAALPQIFKGIQIEEKIVQKEFEEARQLFIALKEQGPTTNLLIMEMRIARGLHDVGMAKDTLERYLQAQRIGANSLGDFYIYNGFAEVCYREENWQEANDAFSKACKAHDTLYLTCPDADTRKRFPEKHAEWIENWQDCLHRLERSEEAEALSHHYEQLEEKLSPQKQERPKYIPGWRDYLLHLLAAVSIIAAIIFGNSQLPNPQSLEVGFAKFLIGLSIFCLLFLLISWGAAARGNDFGKHFGWINLGIAQIPWILYAAIRLFVQT